METFASFETYSYPRTPTRILSEPVVEVKESAEDMKHVKAQGRSSTSYISKIFSCKANTIVSSSLPCFPRLVLPSIRLLSIAAT
jgi:hypothetical protein